MTLSSENNKNSYTANGTNTTFSYTFKVLDLNDLQVYIDDVLQSAYTATGAGNDAGGDVVFSIAPVSGKIVTIVRNESFTQQINYIEGDDFPAEAHEQGLDRSVMRDLTLKEKLDRALILPVSSVASGQLPSPEGGKLLAWNAGGNGIEYIESTDASSNSVTALGSTESRSFAIRFADVLNVKDYGAIGDGVTEDSVAIQTAVNKAYTSNKYLFWPSGTYLATSSINNLHSVRHSGQGAIKRGSDLFYVSLQNALQENHIYISTSGVNTNDGLSASYPIRYQDIRNLFNNYGPFIAGKWFFEFAAGTYNVTSSTAVRLGPDNEVSGLFNESEKQFFNPNFIVFRGPDVGWHETSNPYPLPTAIFDADGRSSSIFNFKSLKAYVKDIKFANANGSASSNGILVSRKAELYCINVHVDNCTYGVSALEHSFYQVRGGIFDGSGYGPNGTSANRDNVAFRSLFHVKHNIGNQFAGAVDQGPIVRNCDQGILAQEMGTGHADFTTFENNTIAIRSRINSRINMNGSEFKRNTACGIADTGGNIGWIGNEVLNIGTSDENNTTFSSNLGGSIFYAGSGRDGFQSYALDTRIIDLDNTRTTITGTTTETYYKLFSIPTGYLNVTSGSTLAGKTLKCTINGVINNNSGTGNISFQLRLGEFGGTLPITTSMLLLSSDANSGIFVLEMEVYIFDSSSDQADSHCKFSSRSGNQKSIASGFIDNPTLLSTAGRKQLRLSVVPSDNADSVTIRNVKIEVSGI